MASSLVTILALSALSLVSPFPSNTLKTALPINLQPTNQEIFQIQPLYASPKNNNDDKVSVDKITTSALPSSKFDVFNFFGIFKKDPPSEESLVTTSEQSSNKALKNFLVLTSLLTTAIVPPLFLQPTAPFTDIYANTIIPIYDNLYFDFPIFHSSHGLIVYDFVKMTYGYIGAALADSTLLYLYTKNPNLKTLSLLFLGVPFNILFFTYPTFAAASTSGYSLFLFINYIQSKRDVN